MCSNLSSHQIYSDDVLDLLQLLLHGPLDVGLLVARAAAVDDVVQIRGRFGQLEFKVKPKG